MSSARLRASVTFSCEDRFGDEFTAGRSEVLKVVVMEERALTFNLMP